MFDISFGASGVAGDGLESMYQEVILDAAKNPHGKTHFLSTDALATAELQEETANSETQKSAEITLNNAHEGCALGQSHQFNPTCGDEVTMRVEIAADENNAKNQIVKSIKWDGHGCSISQASLSMMVDLVEGKSVEEALKLDALFHKLMESRGAGLQNEEEEDALEDAMVLQGVSRYPMRIKCALLAWEGLKDSIAKAMKSL